MGGSAGSWGGGVRYPARGGVFERPISGLLSIRTATKIFVVPPQCGPPDPPVTGWHPLGGEDLNAEEVIPDLQPVPARAAKVIAAAAQPSVPAVADPSARPRRPRSEAPSQLNPARTLGLPTPWPRSPRGGLRALGGAQGGRRCGGGCALRAFPCAVLPLAVGRRRAWGAAATRVAPGQ